MATQERDALGGRSPSPRAEGLRDPVRGGDGRAATHLATPATRDGDSGSASGSDRADVAAGIGSGAAAAASVAGGGRGQRGGASGPGEGEREGYGNQPGAAAATDYTPPSRGTDSNADPISARPSTVGGYSQASASRGSTGTVGAASADLRTFSRAHRGRESYDISVARPGYVYGDRILFSGWLRKQSGGVLKRWQKRYFIIFQGPQLPVMRYYHKITRSSYGVIPLDESGAIPVTLFDPSITTPAHSKDAPVRFSIKYRRYGTSKYPGEYEDANRKISPPTKDSARENTKVMHLKAERPEEKKKWTDLLSSLMDQQSGMDGGSAPRARGGAPASRRAD